jgi:hypothetical protein
LKGQQRRKKTRRGFNIINLTTTSYKL